jgi:hypothetical protein
MVRGRLLAVAAAVLLAALSTGCGGGSQTSPPGTDAVAGGDVSSGLAERVAEFNQFAVHQPDEVTDNNATVITNWLYKWTKVSDDDRWVWGMTPDPDSELGQYLADIWGVEGIAPPAYAIDATTGPDRTLSFTTTFQKPEDGGPYKQTSMTVHFVYMQGLWMATGMYVDGWKYGDMIPAGPVKQRQVGPAPGQDPFACVADC